MNVFDLQAKIGLDSKEYESGLNSARRKAATFAKVGIGAIVAGTAAATAGFIKATKSTADYGDHVDKMSQKIGISAEAYQKWDYVMKRAGGNVDSLKMGMKTLSKQAESNSDAFQKLGISQEEVKNSSQEELFEKTVKGLSKMEAGTERATLASQLLGRAGADLGPLLNQGSGAIEEQMEIAEKYGMIMPDSAVKASAAFKDSLTTLQMTFQGMRNRLMGEFLPSITKVTDGLALVFTGDYDKGLDKINDGISDFVGNMSKALPKVMKVGGQIVSSLGKAIIQNLPTLLSSGVEITTEIITGIINSLPMIIDSMGEVIVAVSKALADGLPKIISAIKNGMPQILAAAKQMFSMLVNGLVNNIPNIINGLISMHKKMMDYLSKNLPQWVAKAGEMIKSLVSGIIQNLPQILGAIVKLGAYMVQNLGTIAVTLIKSGWEFIKSLVSGIVQGIASLLAPAVDAIKDAVMKPINALKDLLANAWAAIKSKASSAWGAIKSLASSVWNAIKSVVMSPVNALKSALSSAWGAIKSKASSMWNSIKSAITKPFTDAYNKIKDILAKIKKMFPFNLGKIFKGQVDTPSLVVEKRKSGAATRARIGTTHFAKAMANPYMFTEPTIFDQKVAGEAGDEILYGHSSLMRDITNAVKSGGNNGDIIINLNYNASDDANDMLKDISRGVRRYRIAGVM